MYSLSDAIIIGITGSYGKTSTAYILHEYLRSIGKKSVLFSSCLIDSPAGRHPVKEGMDFSFGTEKQIAKVLKEALDYEAEYIILECWEHSIINGVFDHVPFDLKCLTQLWTRGGNGDLNAEQYFQSKLRFFKNEEDAVCLLNVQSDDFERFVEEAAAENIVLADTYYGVHQDYVHDYQGEDLPDVGLPITYKIKNAVAGLEQQSATLVLGNDEVDVETTLAAPHLSNILLAAAILKEVDSFNATSFANFIADPYLQIPGRMEDVEWRGRTILIDAQRYLSMPLTAELKGNRPLKVVDSVLCTSNVFNEPFVKKHPEYTPKEDINRITLKWTNLLADYAYLTTNNMSKFTWRQLKDRFEEVCKVPHECIEDRKAAIKKAIQDSDEGDIICIVNRGNRHYLFLNYYHAVIFNDSKVVKEILEELDKEME